MSSTLLRTRLFDLKSVEVFLASKLTYIYAILYDIQQIPVWWRWYYWASPVAWTLYGLITSQLGDNNTEIVIPGAGSMAVKEFLKQSWGYNHDFLPQVAVAHIGWVVLFAFVFAFGIKFFNFQKR